MNDPETTVLRANRILVALDTSARGRAALAAAVRLALSTSAELQGLFVEDEDLVRLAALPFSCEIDSVSASPRELHSSNMERSLRTAADKTQQAFAQTLQQLNLHWTFRIMRGTVAQTSIAAAGDVDLLVIGQQGRSPRIMASEYLPKRLSNDKRVVAVFDGTSSGFRTLECANRLAEPNVHPLSVVVVAKHGDEVMRQCMSWLEQENVRAEVDQVLNPSEEAIIDLVVKWRPGVLLINRDSTLARGTQISRLVNELDCPLILC